MKPSHGTTRKALRWQALYAIVLVPVFAAVLYAAFWLRFEGQLTPPRLNLLFAALPLVVLIKLAVFGWFRIHQSWNRYATFHDLVTLGKAASVSSLCLVVADYSLFPSAEIPRSVLLLDWGMTIFFVGGLRALTRLIDERSPAALFSRNGKPVFIVGANDSGEALLRAIRRNRNLSYRVAGFLTEDQASIGSWIGGVPVMGSLDETCRLAKLHGVAEVLITAGELSGQQVRRLVDEARENGVTVKVLPSYEQLIHGNLDFRPRTVSIEDLLSRDPVELNLTELHGWIDGRVLLVTGSAGSIGSEICRQLVQFDPQRIVLVDRSENGQFYLERELRTLAPHADIHLVVGDVTDGLRMNHLFKQYRPDIVFHAAAYKHVPLMEAHPGEAVKNITLATRMLADLANQFGVGSFVMISTDKAVNPTSVMGTCKRVAELYVQALAGTSSCRFVTVRFGNVLDSAGSVVPIFREQIAGGGPVTVTHPDMRRYFMTIPEASQLVIQAGAMGQGGEIFVLDMGSPVRIVDLATDMIRLSGLRVDDDIEITFTGPRNGEKLFEELHADSEHRVVTTHPKIMVAKSQARSLADVRLAMTTLARLADGPDEQIRAELGRIVPEYDVEAAETDQVVYRAA